MLADVFVCEYVLDDLGGSITLDVPRQVVSVTRAGLDTFSFTLADVAPGLQAYWLSGIGRWQYYLAGRDATTGVGALALVEVRGDGARLLSRHALPGARAITCVDEFPDGSRVACLDGVRHDVWIFDARTGGSFVLARAELHSELARGRYLSVWPVHSLVPGVGTEGVTIRVSTAPEEYQGLGRLSGSVFSLTDGDGDGVFETPMR